MNKKNIKNVISILIISFLFLIFFTVELDIKEIFQKQNIKIIINFFLEFSKPKISILFLNDVKNALVETLVISVLSTILAFLTCFLLLIFFLFKNPILNTLIKFKLSFLRSIPELVWVILLMISLGLGPFSGMIALSIHTIGVLGKLFIETLENETKENNLSFKVSGNNEFKLFIYQILPNIYHKLLNYTLYRWENNIRAASILGIIGAGGLGQMLHFHLSLFHYNHVSTIIISILSIIIIVDQTSFFIRKKILEK